MLFFNLKKKISVDAGLIKWALIGTLTSVLLASIHLQTRSTRPPDGSSLVGRWLIESGMMCAVSGPSSCLPASPLG